MPGSHVNLHITSYFMELGTDRILLLQELGSSHIGNFPSSLSTLLQAPPATRSFASTILCMSLERPHIHLEACIAHLALGRCASLSQWATFLRHPVILHDCKASCEKVRNICVPGDFPQTIELQPSMSLVQAVLSRGHAIHRAQFHANLPLCGNSITPSGIIWLDLSKKIGIPATLLILICSEELSIWSSSIPSKCRP